MKNDLDTFIRHALAAAQETRCLELGSGLLAGTPQVFQREFGDRPALLVADPNTFAAAGQAVFAAFRRTGRALAEPPAHASPPLAGSAPHPAENGSRRRKEADLKTPSGGSATQPALGPSYYEPFIYRDPELHAEDRFLAPLEEALRARPAAIPVAVGSGTINDLTKLAAHRAGRPYMAVATAASMDGYTAFGASITHEGCKQTFPCPAPVAVIADLEVIRAAPAELNAAGYADLLAKSTAGADWLLADAFGLEPINERAWEIVQSRLREVLANPAGVQTGDLEALGQLTGGLMLGGFAMQWSRTSRAASGCEHLFSHLWDMELHTYAGKTPWHGFKVGIGTLAVTALYEYLLALPLAELDPDRCCANWPDPNTLDRRITELFPEGPPRTVALAETQAKTITRAGLRSQLESLRAMWPRLRKRLQEQLVPYAQLKAMLQAAGAPTEPEQIGISRPRLRRSFWQASFLRRRFTVLDLALRTGTLDAALDRLFGPGGALERKT